MGCSMGPWCWHLVEPMVQSWIAPILAPREHCGSLPGLVDLPEYQSSPSCSSGLSHLFGVCSSSHWGTFYIFSWLVDITVEVSEDHRSSVPGISRGGPNMSVFYPSNSWPYFLLDFYHCPENQASERSLEEREESDLQPSLWPLTQPHIAYPSGSHSSNYSGVSPLPPIHCIKFFCKIQ